MTIVIVGVVFALLLLLLPPPLLWLLLLFKITILSAQPFIKRAVKIPTHRSVGKGNNRNVAVAVWTTALMLEFLLLRLLLLSSTLVF